MSSLAAPIGAPQKIPPLFLVAGIFAEVLAVVLSLQFPLEIFAVICGVGVLYWSAQNTFFGLCFLVLLHYFVIRSTEGISLMEVVFALCFCVVLGSWFFRKIFLERGKILRDHLDYALTGFLALCVFSVVPAVLSGASLIKWLRELIPFLNLLLVFPLREELNSTRRIKIISACFLTLSLAVAVQSILAYKQAIISAVYAWELLALRQSTNAPLFLAIVIFGGAFFILGKTKRGRGAALFITIFFTLALIVTFARGFWVAALFGALAIFWLLPYKDKTRLMIYFGVLTLIAIGVVFFFFGDIAEFFLKTVSSRFQTVGGAVQDKSFANRLLEWQAVFDQIKVNPILGYGLGKTYFYNALIPIEMPTWYVHNTFLFVWYKIGLFGLIALMLFLTGMLARSLHIYRTNNDEFLKAFAAGLMGCIIALIVVSFSSPQFIEKDSSLLGALIGGVIQAVSASRASKAGEISSARNRKA